MPVYLEGIAARFYRGIGAEIQYIAPFAEMNLFIGANNAGKSIVLNLIKDHLPEFGSVAYLKLPHSEKYQGSETGKFTVSIGVTVDSFHEQVVDVVRARRQNFREDDLDLLRKLLSEFSEVNGIWFEPNQKTRNWEFFEKPEPTYAAKWLQEDQWHRLWSSVTHQSGGGLLSHWIPQTFNEMGKIFTTSFPERHLIPAKRTLGKKDEAFDDLSGKGLIDHMATLQNPSYDRQDLRETFQKITEFVRTVTGKPEAQLEIPHDREHLLVHIDNKVMPLEALGTGIHEVVLIAAFCTIHQHKIMCIEEPEIHLHPVLQRKLIQYLKAETENQYFIATHSSAFIDMPGAAVFHVHNDGRQTYVKNVISKDDKRRILDDLGCQASDILQANAVIWVEGPSDRIYLNHWIKAVAPDLVEGIHYTIMFYGGALISHLSGADEVGDFIRLRDLNRHMAVVMDSDRKDEATPLKPNVSRISEELAAGAGLAWVTAGREIENYCDPVRLQAALKDMHPAYDGPAETGPFDHAYHFFPKTASARRERVQRVDKVRLAARLCGDPADLDRLDLRDRLADLVALIRRANASPPAAVN